MNSNFEIHFTNIRGFKSNFISILSHLHLNRPSLLSLGEVQATSLNDFECPGYSRVECLVPHRGIVLLVRNDLNFNIPPFVSPSSNPAFNTLWVEIKLLSHSVFICSVYRSPSLSYFETCQEFDLISNSIDQIYRLCPTAEVVVLGDFNAHNDTWLKFSHGRDQVGEAVEIFANVNLLEQLVDQPTRYPDRTGQLPHLLDLFLTTMPDKYIVEVGAPLGSSDHAVISAKFPMAVSLPERLPSKLFWHFNNVNWLNLNDYYHSIDWSTCFINKTAEEAAISISSVIQKGINLFVPCSYKKSNSKKNKWFNKNCREAISIKKAAHLVYLRCPSDDNLINFKKARNQANATITRAKLDHEIKTRTAIRKILNFNKNSRSFWSFADLVKRNFCGKSSSVPTLFYNNTYYKTPSEKAELLASMFSSASTLPHSSQCPPVLPSVATSMPTIYFRKRVVSKALKDLNPNKASGPDGIPSIVLKNCHNTLATPLSRLFHLSMKTGVFPSIWKTANVQPVPKKGDKTSPSNYRPIALLSVISKVMESIVNFKIVSYLEANSLISDFQYGFRKSRSSGDLMAYLAHCWQLSIEKLGETSVVSLDISKAFDRVWHDGLISKLQSFNLHGSLIEWIRNYLSNRTIQVVLDGLVSMPYSINAGVPQGSSLSPTLFLMYINDLLSLPTCEIHSFADDTTLSISSKFNSLKECNASLSNYRIHANDSILSNLDLIFEWGRANRVEFNPNKFQFCLFSKKKDQSNISPLANGFTIEKASSLKMLGLQISSDLSFKDHIYSISKRAAQCLGFIRRCNFYFTPSEVLTVYKSYVRPIMEFNSFVWGGAAKSNLTCLDRIQKRVEYMINDTSVISHLKSLEHRRNVGALTVFYKYFFHRSSLEIASVLPEPFISRANTRFGSKQHKFALEPFRCRTLAFQNSFFPRATSLWNKLDISVFPKNFNVARF